MLKQLVKRAAFGMVCALLLVSAVAAVQAAPNRQDPHLRPARMNVWDVTKGCVSTGATAPMPQRSTIRSFRKHGRKPAMTRPACSATQPATMPPAVPMHRKASRASPATIPSLETILTA